MWHDLWLHFSEKSADFLVILPGLFPFIIMFAVGWGIYHAHRAVKRLQTKSYETAGHLLERGKPTRIKNSKTNKVSYRYKIKIQFNGETHTFRVSIPETLKDSFEAITLTESLALRFDPSNSKQFYLSAWNIYRIDFRLFAYAFYLAPATQKLWKRFENRSR